MAQRNANPASNTPPIPSSPIALDDLFPVDGLAAAFPNLLTEAVLRHQLRSRDTNGLASACVRVGKKLLISRTRYEAWLGSRAGGGSVTRNARVPITRDASSGTMLLDATTSTVNWLHRLADSAPLVIRDRPVKMRCAACDAPGPNRHNVRFTHEVRAEVKAVTSTSVFVGAICSKCAALARANDPAWCQMLAARRAPGVRDRTLKALLAALPPGGLCSDDNKDEAPTAATGEASGITTRDVPIFAAEAIGCKALALSSFAGLKAAPTARVLTWSALCEHLAGPEIERASKAECNLLKLATFGKQPNARGSLRHDANLVEVSGIEGDYDGELVSLDEAADKLAALDVATFLYTSASHTTGKPRWRVLAPLSKPCAPAQRRHYVGLLNAALGGILARESFTLSQTYYVGKVKGATYATRQVPGMPIDVALGLVVEPVFPAGKSEQAGETDDLDRAAAIARADDQVLAELRSAVSALNPGNRETWVRVGQALKGLGHAGRDVWMEWSARSDKFEDGRSDPGSIWDSFTGDRTDYRAVFAEAQRYGWVNPAKAVLETERERSIRIGHEGEHQVPTQRVMTGTEMLAELVFVAEGARVAFVAEPRFSLPIAEFRHFTAASVEKAKGPKNATRKVHRASLWMESADRKTVRTVTFAPGRGRITQSPEDEPALNLWLPRAAQVPANWHELAQSFFDHVEYLVPIESERLRFLDWLAHIEQQPGTLPHTHYLLVTKQTGIGRNWLAYALARVFAGYTALGFNLAETLRTGFNGALSQRMLAVVDELHEGGPGGTTRPVAEKLKSLLTEATRRVNPKYGRQHVEFNCCRFLMFSNHEAALPLAENDRRVVVLENPTARRPPDYYSRLYEMLGDRAFGPALAEALRRRDIKAFNPGEPAPMSEAKARTIRAGRSEMEQAVRDIAAEWTSDCITAGELNRAVAEALGLRNINTNTQAAAVTAGLTKRDGRVKVNRESKGVWIVRNAARWVAATGADVAAEVLRGAPMLP